MNDESNILDFFLGSNTPEGFVSLFDEITGLYKDYVSYVIKGGPGTGKSTLMKKCAAEASLLEPYLERIHCSSDPNSLDAVILPGAKVTIADGTPPHVIEPQFPGAYESVVNFCDCWDEEDLQKNREAVISLSEKVSACHRQCVGLLKAAHSLLQDNFLLAMACTDGVKATKAADNILERECKRRRGLLPKEHKRFLSAITPKGLLCCTDTVNRLCDRIYVLKDSYGASGTLFMEELRTQLLQRGFEIYTCICPLNPHDKIEHIFVPELRLGFVTANPFLPLEKALAPYRVIHFTRFTDMEALKKKKQRMRFNQRMAAELLDESVRSLQKAKSIHDALEQVYGHAMDYKKINDKAQAVLEAIRQKYPAEA